MNKYERQGAIMRLVQQRSLSTQSEVADALRDAGYEVVQTTVSDKPPINRSRSRALNAWR